MQFAPLYDRNRNLFYIGYDCTKGAYSKSWYDLMASEHGCPAISLPLAAT